MPHWVYDTFHIPISTHSMRSKNGSYGWLLSPQDLPEKGKCRDIWLAKHNDVTKCLGIAEEFVKRALLVLQISWDDMVDKDHDNKYQRDLKLMIQNLIILHDKILDTIYAEKRSAVGKKCTPLRDDFVPEDLENVSKAKERNDRDWIFLDTVHTMLETITALFLRLQRGR